MAIKAPKGTKDVLPNEIHKWQYIEKEWAKICAEYGFKENLSWTILATILSF